ncbi:hypothetical protein TrVFT333_006650 [Trichoderma virens FT-333]|nr:hypothetical protein TrVFT333_006650 [Trichoderma virens FT-333]
MSSNPPNVFRRLRSRFKTQKDHENPAKPSTTSTPATQSRDASPSRAEARPATVLKEATPEALPLNAPERLWDEAYDAIRHDDANLVDGYERILSQYLRDRGLVADSDISQQNTIAANSPDVRRKQMNELIRAGLDKTAREAKVKGGLGTAMGIILSLKNMVSTAVAAVPQASIAWSGVCIALGVLEGAIKETAMNRDGIEYIITRIRWYGNVSSLLLDEGTLDDSALSGMKSELEKRLVELYKALLIYQMRSVCSHHRNGSYSFLRDLLKVDDWAVSIQDIQKAEDSLRQDAEVYGNQQFRSRLEHIVDHAKSQELEIKNMARTLEEQLRRQISAEDRNCLRELWPHDPYVEKRRIEDTKGACYRTLSTGSSRTTTFVGGSKIQTVHFSGSGKLAPSSLISFFFCQATDERINNSTAVLRGLIFSLIDQQQHLLEHLREPYARQGKSLFEPPSAWYALSSILQSLLSDLNNTQQPTCLLVDALDECVNEDMPRLLDFIVKMSNELPHVKWVVSSRNWPQIIDKLKNLGPESQLSLELNAESQRIQQEKEEAVRDYLLSNADGTFLWVALSCKNLERASPWIGFTLLQKIPPGLDSLYEQMVNTLARCDEAEICKRILAVATVARRPVTLEELIVLAETPGESDEKSEAVCDLIGQCGSFLTIRDEVVYFVHQSAKDFLVETAAKKTFFLGIEKASHYMVARSIKLMSETLKRDIYGIKDLGIHIDDVQVLTSQPLTAIGYSCVHWVDHFMDTIPSMDEETIDATQRFIETKYLCWLEALSLLRKLPEGVMAMRKLQEFFVSLTNIFPMLLLFQIEQ